MIDNLRYVCASNSVVIAKLQRTRVGCSTTLMFCRWGYKRDPVNNKCIPDEKLNYKAVLSLSTNQSKSGEAENMDPDSIFNYKLKPVTKRKQVPWSVRAVYNLNYFSAVVLNHTIKFYNLAGLEDWSQSWQNNSTTSLHDRSLIFCMVIYTLIFCAMSYIFGVS